MSDETRAYIRWLIRRDMPEVLAIEDGSFESPWQEDDFIRSLRRGNCIGMVAEYDGRVVGFMLYELYRNRIHVVNFAVSPEFRRHGVGSQMVAKLLGKLSPTRRHTLVADVREGNLVAQKFFHSCGLRAVDVLHSQYEDTPEDGYRFVYRVKRAQEFAA